MAPFLVFSLVALTLEFFSHDSGDMLWAQREPRELDEIKH